MVVANDITMAGAGFGEDTNIVTFVFPDGQVRANKKMSKTQTADKILNELAKML